MVRKEWLPSQNMKKKLKNKGRFTSRNMKKKREIVVGSEYQKQQTEMLGLPQMFEAECALQK